MKFIAMIFGAVMNLIYSVFKCRKTRNVISFISRQSETPSMDFRYLINEIKTNYPQYEVVVLCKMIPSGIGGKIRYVSEMFRQMKVMAVSRVVVLDGYCILASMLSHKKDLKIVQIWHALHSLQAVMPVCRILPRPLAIRRISLSLSAFREWIILQAKMKMSD